MGPMIRAASLRGFAPLVAELGGDPDRLLARFGLHRDVLAEDDALVSITTNDLLLDAAAAELGCPDLGLRLAVEQDLSILGPLAVAIQTSSTVSEALRCVSTFLFVHSPALTIAVEPDARGRRGVIALTYRKDLHESPYSAQAIELGLGLFHQFAVILLGGSTGLRSVEIPHGPLSPVDRYTDFFGVDVRFGRPTAALCVQRSVLDERFVTANESIRRIAVEFLASNYADPGHETSTQVRRALAESLATRPATIGDVSSLLAVHPRTLQRRLAGEGTTFQVVLEQVRRDATRRYLTTTTLPLTQVALLVGFTEQSTLSRAARRWWGLSPRDLRRTASANLSC